MTTPDTSAVRAWARSNGFDVAARGRLPAEVVDAYTASRQGSASGADPARKPARKSTTKPAAKRAVTTKPAAEKASGARTPAEQAPAEKASAKRAPAGQPGARKARGTRTKTAAARTRSTRARSPQDEGPVATPAPADLTEAFADASLEAITTDPPTPHATPASDRALQLLVEQVHALTARVEALEARAALPDKPAKSLFRRQR